MRARQPGIVTFQYFSDFSRIAINPAQHYSRPSGKRVLIDTFSKASERESEREWVAEIIIEMR